MPVVAAGGGLLAGAGAAEEVGEALGGWGLSGLVNNAGTAIGGPLALQALGEVRTHFEVNVVGMSSVTQAFLPLLGAKSEEPGRIVNVGSTGGKIASPFIGAYAGTKHAVEGISDALRRELLLYGIDVILIEPGAVRTEIWDKGASQAGRYNETDYAEPLDRFRRYAGGLAKSGYSPRSSAVTSAKSSRRRGRGPGTPSCQAGSPTSRSRGCCPTAGSTAHRQERGPYKRWDRSRGAVRQTAKARAAQIMVG